MRLSLFRRILQLIAALAVGLVVGGLGAVVQANRSTILGHSVPWGVLLSVATVGVTVRAACWWYRGRLGGVAVALGWVLASVVLASTSAGGSVLLPDTHRSQAYLAGGALVALFACLLPLPRTDSRSAPGELGPPEPLPPEPLSPEPLPPEPLPPEPLSPEQLPPEPLPPEPLSPEPSAP